MGDDLKWLVGAIVTLVTMIGGVIARDRHVMDAIKEGDEKLSDRLTKVQAEYVRRDDLNDHIQSMGSSIQQMREEQRETNRRIDNLLTVLSKKD